MKLFSDPSVENIVAILEENKAIPTYFVNAMKDKSIDINNMNIEHYRRNIIGLFVEKNAAI